MMLTQRKNDRPRYRLQDAGYATLKRIHQGKERRGHVTRNSDGVYTARIGTVEVQAPSEADAFRHVVAKVEGLDVSEIRHDVLHQKKVQADTEIILDWLKPTPRSMAAGWRSATMIWPTPSASESRIEHSATSSPASTLAATSPASQHWAAPPRRRFAARGSSGRTEVGISRSS
jgi:hypothetical protein